ncbi:hypothetical protein NLJ89_g7011 [Agrocybe chaxingu]|uniref:non-specific serine/threonine protein kinase n=1 Tax=Agrocybe chaxingu TaxID=84603 RepID=A0A9W8MVV5_9AGAR|nr:hypothetical protein NLJ89_g7011 [Agrocybe chaxingu]
MASSSFLDQYESLDVIGNGSFGIIRKVRRKTDGLRFLGFKFFARKELNFERMSERDRKQIVAEVNILKDLHHDHIVRYHDRYVDRDAGILYILMEYCGGGDLSTVIKQATKQNRPIPEDIIWHYFHQILLALQHCHHPGHVRSGSGSGGEYDGPPRRAQILHRDLKPDNVFLDENGTVKLGDFGLSKALPQASFANTYVGTPYYMSPELMQEKAYDSKSDIWSLGCLIYELCALKPPFHEAKTHSELSIFIRNGRIPPLPRGYSQTLAHCIKSMLNLNPAMRPSAAQLLQHERIDMASKVSEAEKMLNIVKAHRADLTTRERAVIARENAFNEKEQRFADLLSAKDQEITSLKQMLAQMQSEVERTVKAAVAAREEELRILVTEREAEVGQAMAEREEEVLRAVREREAEICNAWVKHEEEIRKEVEENFKAVEERVEWAAKREVELKEEERKLAERRAEVEKLEANIAAVNAATKGRKEKSPLEEVKNVLEPLSRAIHSQATPTQQQPTQRRRNTKTDIAPPPSITTSTTSSATQPTQRPANVPPPAPTSMRIPSLETPISRPTFAGFIPPLSAMKGVVLTSTGETLATPSPAELVSLLNCSPRVGLNFARIFDFEERKADATMTKEKASDVLESPSPPPSPSTRKERDRLRERRAKEKGREAEKDDEDESSGSSTATTQQQQTPQQLAPPPTRIRRPSIRTAHRTSRKGTLPASTSEPAVGSSSSSASASSSTHTTTAKPLPHPHLRPSTSASNLNVLARAASLPILPITVPRSHPSPEYDFADEENLPSPFLRKVEKNAAAKAGRSISSVRLFGDTATSSSGSANGTTNAHTSSATSSSSSSASTATMVSTSSAASSSTKVKRRPSSGLLLRAVAAANSAGRRVANSQTGPNPHSPVEDSTTPMGVEFPSTEHGESIQRSSLANARRATEEARKALVRS